MTKTNRSIEIEANLKNAISQREAARALWESVDKRDRTARICAEENLHFWQGKVANLEAMLKAERTFENALKAPK